jgi:hypothetical protein
MERVKNYFLATRNSPPPNNLLFNLVFYVLGSMAMLKHKKLA